MTKQCVLQRHIDSERDGPSASVDDTKFVLQEAASLHTKSENGLHILDYIQKQQNWAPEEQQQRFEPLVWGAASLIEVMLDKADRIDYGDCQLGGTFDIHKVVLCPMLARSSCLAQEDPTPVCGQGLVLSIK